MLKARVSKHCVDESYFLKLRTEGANNTPSNSRYSLVSPSCRWKWDDYHDDDDNNNNNNYNYY